MPGKAAVDKAAAHQRWERNSRWARRVGSFIGGPVERRIERFLLRRAWGNAQPERLQRYLVGGFQNPVINVQSILARHELIRELYGDVHADLMAEELQWAAGKHREYSARRRLLVETTGKELKQLKRSGADGKVYAEVMADSDLFANRWTEALSEPPEKRLRVIEAACGSANDYRFFASYGLAGYLDYTGFDITQANIDNARRMFPGVDFHVGDVQDVDASDGAYDWAVAHDLLEHLSPQAFNRAIDELCRVTRRGVLISFFMMGEHPEHKIVPRRFYHVNDLSKDRISERFAEHCSYVQWFHIRPMVKELTGFGGYYSGRAWTIIARH